MGEESGIRRRIKKVLEDAGCFVLVTHGSGLQIGIPDLIVFAPLHIRPNIESAMTKSIAIGVAIEVKTPTGKLSEVQMATLRKIRRSGGIAIVADTPVGIGERIQEAAYSRLGLVPFETQGNTHDATPIVDG